MTQPNLTLEQAWDKIATLTVPKVTKEGIDAKIDNVDYVVHNATTICFITMKSGFVFLGHSTPASLANFDTEVGQSIAYHDAFNQIWGYEGYLLREVLSHQGDETTAEVEPQPDTPPPDPAPEPPTAEPVTPPTPEPVTPPAEVA